jgi:hypothetical protein
MVGAVADIVETPEVVYCGRWQRVVNTAGGGDADCWRWEVEEGGQNGERPLPS